MTNTSSDDRRLFIVSFGDSSEYKLFASNRDDALKTADEVGRELNAFFAKKYPGRSFAYYTTPKVREVEADCPTDYASYPVFDENAKALIKKTVLNEIQDQQDTRELNDADPYGI